MNIGISAEGKATQTITLLQRLTLKLSERANASIDKEISMLPISEYPSKPNSLLVLAAHSGNSIISYFNYLYKLKPDDKIYINYSNQIYEYKIIDIYNQKKDGNVDIYRIYNKRTLVLVTCTNNKKGWQTVYIAIQINH